MKKFLIICGTFFTMSASLPALTEDPVGHWTGLVEGAVHLNIYLTKTPTGQHEVTVISPDQRTFTIKTDKVKAVENLMRFSIPKLKATMTLSRMRLRKHG